MRRPTFCSDTARTDDDCYCCTAGQPLLVAPDKEESRLARVKRMLAGTLSMGQRRTRTFGVRFNELPAGKDGVPKIVTRLCGYIENYGLRCAGLFRLSAGNPKLVERLRLQFDRTGDADLETAGDPHSVASLLKVWLRELPEPIIVEQVAEELLDIQEKFHEDLPEWRAAVAESLAALPEPNLLLLHYLLHFLHACRHPAVSRAAAPRCRHTAAGDGGGMEAVFAPLLVDGSLVRRNAVATQLTARLIRDVKHLFDDRFVEHAYQAAVGSSGIGWSAGSTSGGHADADTVAQPMMRKRKERHESFNSQSQERKVIRSNSEERPLETSDKDNIRRVSSHEDFSLVKANNNKTNNNKNNNNNKGGFLSELIDPTMGHGVHYSQPLHEHNSPAVSRHAAPHHVHHPHHPHDEADGGLEDEHERRRSSERFARAMAPRGRRNLARRRKGTKNRNDAADSSSGSSKENEDDCDGSANANQLTPVSSSTSDDDSGRDDRHKSHHAFLQLHPQEKERSPSPSSSPSTPHLAIASLHDLVDCNEPLKSRGHWSFSHRTQEDEVVASQVMLSPRNSLVFPRRGNLDPNVPPSPPQEHNPRGLRPSQGQLQDMKVKQLNKQISSIKRKLKRFEEAFERENGYRPSHADKMGNREVKNLGADLIKLRKEMKLLKEECHLSLMAKPLGFVLSSDHSPPSGSHHNKGAKNVSMEDLLQEVEEHLSEKRASAGRPDNLDELSRDQLMDEKVALQKGLLYLESVFGRPVTRIERDIVRPLYDRYRTLKRMVIRTGSSKLKDSVSELATILEHETMDFTSLPPASTAADEDTVTIPAAMLPDSVPVNAAEPVASESSDSQLKNLHSLPLSQLLDQQRTIREDKKQLRRSLREFEDEFHRRTGKKLQREDRLPMETVYVAYKQAKAKLRLLEALVSKQTSCTQ